MPKFFDSNTFKNQVVAKDKFGGNYHLLTEDHWHGLNKICNTASSRFNPNNIISINQIEENGKLKAIRLHCDDNPGWLIRALSPISLGYQDINNHDGIFSIDLNPEDVKNIKYSDLFRKFNGGIPRLLNDNHLDALKDFQHRVEGLMLPFTSPIAYEERLANFDPETKMASGPLKSVMLKVSLFPNSHRGTLKTPQDFVNKVIEPLKQQLGSDFSRLVVSHGMAIDGRAYIELDESVLAQGFNVTQNTMIFNH